MITENNLIISYISVAVLVIRCKCCNFNEEELRKMYDALVRTTSVFA